MRPGEHGQITVKLRRGTYFASTYVRDADGKRRRVERSSPKSAEDARRILQRHLGNRRSPLSGQAVTERTSLAKLFDKWIETKELVDGVAEQSAQSYRDVWRVHGARQLGALRVTELPTSRADAHLQHMESPSQAKTLRMILLGMFGLAVRYDALSVNPIRESSTVKPERKPVRAASAAEFERVRAAVRAYTTRPGPGPRRGRLLPAFIELLAATGCRPNEVLAIRWCDVDLLGDPPTVTITGTLIDHGRIPGKPLHRRDARKGDAPPHTCAAAAVRRRGAHGVDRRVWHGWPGVREPPGRPDVAQQPAPVAAGRAAGRSVVGNSTFIPTHGGHCGPR
jgi:integrase